MIWNTRKHWLQSSFLAIKSLVVTTVPKPLYSFTYSFNVPEALNLYIKSDSLLRSCNTFITSSLILYSEILHFRISINASPTAEVLLIVECRYVYRHLHSRIRYQEQFQLSCSFCSHISNITMPKLALASPTSTCFPFSPFFQFVSTCKIPVSVYQCLGSSNITCRQAL